jgi:hypothetical protein
MNSNQFMGESNLFLLGDSKKNSMNFFRCQDSQLMSILHGKDTPGDPSNMMIEGSRLHGRSTRNKRGDHSNLLELTPVKTSNRKLRETQNFNSKGFRDLKMNPMFLKDDINRPVSNFIYHNEDPSKGFELTQRDRVNPSQHLIKRNQFYLGNTQKAPKPETPVYDFKNVTQKIYEVDNLKKLKKDKKSEKMSENMEIFFQETDRISRKENKKDASKKKMEENMSFGEKDNSNIGNYSNSVNTRKSTKKYEEGLKKLYSKV